MRVRVPRRPLHGPVAESEDAADLKSVAARREGSTPSRVTHQSTSECQMPLNGKEWVQLGVAMVHYGHMNINGDQMVPLRGILDLLAQYVEGAASYTIQDGRWSFSQTPPPLFTVNDTQCGERHPNMGALICALPKGHQPTDRHMFQLEWQANQPPPPAATHTQGKILKLVPDQKAEEKPAEPVTSPTVSDPSPASPPTDPPAPA